MALIDDILKGKNNQASSFLPLNEEELQEEAQRSPVVEEKKATDVSNEQPKDVVQPQQQSQQEASAAPNKFGYSPEQLDTLAKYGYTPEVLERYASFDPNQSIAQLYTGTVNKPQAPDEKKIRNAKMWGGIADAVGMLSQIFIAGKGAHVRERDYKDSALSQLSAREKELQDQYLQLSQRYDDGLYQARMRDFQNALTDYNAGKKGIQGVLAAKDALDERRRQADAKLQYSYSKMVQDQGNKDRDFELKKENQQSINNHRKALEAQGWSRVADSKSRTSAYVRKISSGGGSSAGYQMIFEANPNDTNSVQQDQFGNNVKVFQMNKGQIDQYYRAALADQEFMNSEAGKALVLQRPKFEGTRMQEGSYKYKPNQDVAAAYLQYQYEKGFIQSPDATSAADQYMFDWGQSFNNAGGIPTEEEEEEEVEYPDDEDLDEDFPVLGNMANF